MQSTAYKRRSPEELSRLGSEILAERVQLLLKPEDFGRFIAIRIDNGDFEIDTDDHAAVSRLCARHPDGGIWLTRVGHSAAYRIGKSQ